MRVCLIDLPISHEQIYGEWDLSALETYCPPLGLLSLAAWLRKHGHEPSVLDLPTLKWSVEDAARHVLQERPGLVGLSARTINVSNAARLAALLKEGGYPGPVVLGGPHVTAVPVPTLERFAAIDCGVTGEGERTLQELVERHAAGRPLDGVQGLAWRDPSGAVRVNAPRPPLEDLDELPLPAWDLLPGFPQAYPLSALETRRLPAASIMTSRGCPFRCTFCDSLVFGHHVRLHSAAYTLDMIRHLRDRYGIHDLMMLDDNFILKQDRLFEICDAMIAERMGLKWYCMGHAHLMTEERLRRIRAAGCWIIEMGIESGCDRILRHIHKHTDKAEVAAAVARARAAGLMVKGNFIFGFPTETRESLEETIAFATGIGLSLFQQNYLTVWPGCEIARDAERYGRCERDWGRLAHQRITFVPEGLTEADLVRASKDSFRRFYLRPRVVLEFLAFMTSWRAVHSVLVGLATFARTAFGRRRAPARA